VSWIRLYLAVEGETELKFANETLKPHLARFNVEVRPRMILTNRKLGVRGGALGYQRLKRDALRLMKDDDNAEARFSTMIDLYALPKDFPGWAAAAKKSTPLHRVAELEKSLAQQFASQRFIPYLQLHEFETLLYCDLRQVSSRIEETAPAISALEAEVARFSSPEDINDGEQTAPSKRLIKHVPRYAKLKVVIGATAAGAIGIKTLRVRCPHFGQWLTQLENLGSTI
jgi:Domain of unknown function (DUF4276)